MSPKAPTTSSSQAEEDTVRTERRQFLATVGGVTAAAAVVNAPNVIAQPKIQWRLSTAYPPVLDQLHGAAKRMAQTVDEMTGGRFRIEVFPGGQIMKPFDCFDAASAGKIEAFMGVTSYWAAQEGKEPGIEWFTTLPFGMNPQGMAAWYHRGDGLKLWEEAYAPYNLVPRPGPAFAPQMAGWFRKKITTIADYKGLKMRISSLGRKVVARAGATTVLTPAADIYAALERGVIDAAEWVGPHDDMALNLHNTARYYYYPGWHEPGTTNEFTFNRKAYDALPVDLRRTLDHAASAVSVYGITDYHAKNALALDRLRTEFKGKVEVLPLPASVLRDLKKLAADVIREESEKTPMARKVHASFVKFQALVGPWDHVAEGAYHQFVGA
jgi:TRAP-type mannitol/chloroaromatic compound transport system substrate-binding protein